MQRTATRGFTLVEMLVAMAVMGIVMYALFAAIEQRMTFWAKRGDGLMA